MTAESQAPTRALTSQSAVALAAAIRAGRTSAREVVEAHIELHRRWAPAINAIVADRFNAARAEAEATDRVIAAWRATADDPAPPPLAGVPFTVKESIAVRGMPNSAGLIARRDHRATTTAPAAQRLLDAGAILLGVTNTSELTLWIESVNRLYGRSSTPYDPKRTAGGSSGGEGAAVGCGGSPFGLGNDIGGSLRIPALFCGVFSHKPTSGTVPNTGAYPPSVGDSGKLLQAGPFARRASDLMPLLRIIAGPDGADPNAHEMTLGNPASLAINGLRVATLGDDTAGEIAPELRDARERAVGALAAGGARPIRVSISRWQHALLPYLATLGAGAQGPTTSELIAQAGDQPPQLLRLLRPGGPHTAATRIALLAERLSGASRKESRRMLAAGRDLVSAIHDAIGDGVILHPAHATPAPRHGKTVGRPWLMMPAAAFNLAGVPVTEVPLGLGPSGVPVGVQVVAPPGRDELSIAVAIELERVFGGWVPPTLPGD